MDSTDRQVLTSAIDWLDAGHRIALATVARTWGSAPRPAGAWAVLRGDGAIVGSVSGGCVEEDLVRRMRDGLFAGDVPEVLTYGVTQEEASRFGLPCGGTLQLVVEPYPDVAGLKQLGRRIADGVVTVRRVAVASGKASLDDAAQTDVLAWDGSILKTIHGPVSRLLIIGANQVSHYLASMAQSLGYAVTVCDPREEYRQTWQVAGTTLLTTMPDDAVLAFKPDAGTAVVTLAHDPKLDDMALIEALRSPAFYVGALGSRPSTSKRKERLAQHFALTDAELERLHAPVGLPIGSHTPPEIAISILAEMTAVRNGFAPDRRG